MNYKVFVVDDEIVIREGLRSNFQWEENSFVLVGEASDGEIALPMIRDERPDILITDIRMPFMDGITLCREVHKVMPWIQIVILSGYDSFEYAKQAMQLGVQEYLLKPISARDLGEVLKRLRDRIEREHAERRDLEKLRTQMTAGRQLVLDQVFGNALANKLSPQEGEKICTQMRSLGINLVSPCYTVIEFRGSGSGYTFADMHAAMMQLTESSRETVFLCSSDKLLCAIVLGDSDRDIEERAYSFARSALDELDRSNYPDARASIGETVTEFGDLRRSYQTARHVRHTFENTDQPLRMRRIIGSRDPEPPPRKSGGGEGMQPLYEHMKYADLGDFQEHFGDYLQSVRQMNVLVPIDGKYLISLRLRKARELLYNTDLRSSEIAYTVGFNDPHYFSYLFKKNLGTTPSEFRAAVGKAHSGGPEEE